MHYALVFIRIHTYLLFYTYSYVFTISHGNSAKSRDFGIYAFVFIRIHMYLLFYTYSYVFTISCGNSAKSSDFGTHA